MKFSLIICAALMWSTISFAQKSGNKKDTSQIVYFVSENNKQGATADLKKGVVNLFLPGGIVGAPEYSSDKSFEKSYQLKFIFLGCVRMEGDNFAEYNQTVFEYLDKKYGKKWRAQIRKDVIGLKP